MQKKDYARGGKRAKGMEGGSKNFTKVHEKRKDRKANLEQWGDREKMRPEKKRIDDARKRG